VGLENVQVVASMNPSSTLGRHELNTRFSSVVRIFYMDYTDREQLQACLNRGLCCLSSPQDIYRGFLTPVMNFKLPGNNTWTSPKNIAKLAGTMIAVYEQVLKFRIG
jgi:dynein heavy chain 2